MASVRNRWEIEVQIINGLVSYPHNNCAYNYLKGNNKGINPAIKCLFAMQCESTELCT